MRGAVSGEFPAGSSFPGDLKVTERATGVVQRVAFTNPHGALTIEIKNAEGVAKPWVLTTGSINVLVAQCSANGRCTGSARWSTAVHSRGRRPGSTLGAFQLGFGHAAERG